MSADSTATQPQSKAVTRLFDVEAAAGDSDQWFTPEWVFDGMGITFDLDVCSPPTGCEWIPRRAFFTEADDGLAQTWHGTVWCNPPYSRPTEWCKKWAQHPEGALLIRADLSTGGPFVAFSAASSCYVAAKRVQFISRNGNKTGLVNFSTILLGRGEVVDRALMRLAAKYGGACRSLTQPTRRAA